MAEEESALKGSELQKAAEKAGFEPSFVALVPFPQVVDYMAGNLTWTSQLGGAFATDRGAVFDAIQRLRKQSQAAGNLKSSPQQTVETQTTKGGEQVIVIEPANPQVVYVPQYNPTVVYTQAAPTTVVVHEDNDDEAAAAVIGFAAGVAIGAAINNNYYYGPYGCRGGAYMYNDGWDDWYDNREDAREDYYENREDAREDMQDHREDMAGERSERAEDAREQRGERAESTQQQRSRPAGSARHARGAGAARAAAHRGAGPGAGGAGQRHDAVGTDVGDVRLDAVGFDAARRWRADEQRAQRHALRLVLRLLERSLDAVRELARQPQPLGRRRRPGAAMSAGGAVRRRPDARPRRLAAGGCRWRRRSGAARLRDARGSGQGPRRHRQGQRPPRPRRALRTVRTGPPRHLRRRHGAAEPGGVRCRGGRGSPARRPGPEPQGADPRQRGLALSGAARQAEPRAGRSTRRPAARRS